MTKAPEPLPVKQSLWPKITEPKLIGFEHSARYGVFTALVMLACYATVYLISLWLNGSGSVVNVAEYVKDPMMVIAGLLVLAGLHEVLVRRNNTALRSRSYFKQRLIYKLPLYAAFTINIVLLLVVLIQLLAALLGFIALIGPQFNRTGSLLLTFFVPALIGIVLFSASSLVLYRRINGVDSDAAVRAIGGVAVAIISLCLFVTTIVNINVSNVRSEQPNRSLDDYFNEYNGRGRE